ncbi:ASST-domain-containing protein [Daldinia decipiens]|uniref:ASST-domain-containing protein n=1 Tax=Daldinia decipiens TaxID=326647 RepID=UPI0020C4485D|nr:ASST-domain-containing protein [Daldinia decipiens]KAI1659179.1 ASST-domain-containing protein [Daldinia decipiens]
MHESQITDQHTILETLCNVTKYCLSYVGGPQDSWVTDSLFYELDVKTHEILFKWSSLDHVDQIPISNVQQFYPVADFGKNQFIPYGYFHINSVDKSEDGSYLIVSRYYCSIFKIFKKTALSNGHYRAKQAKILSLIANFPSVKSKHPYGGHPSGGHLKNATRL